MAGWNLALRFALEIAALVGVAAGAWSLTGGVWRWIAAAVAALAAVTAWGVFNVVGDPSRSGRAPVEVSGVQRLTIEAMVLGLGIVGLVIVVPWLGVIVACATVVHYGFSRTRLAWLLRF
jgi:hypothetical protein